MACPSLSYRCNIFCLHLISCGIFNNNEKNMYSVTYIYLGSLF